jgi:hemerythrin-like domain-containing protein
MKITDALLAEHTVFHSLFECVEKQLTKPLSIERLHLLAELLLGLFEKHGKAEHDLLLPPLEPFLHEIGHLENFHKEDDIIIEMLRQVQEGDNAAFAHQKMLKMLHLANEHFDKEERCIFPLAEKHISEASLEELGAAWALRKDLSPVKPRTNP